MKPENGYKFNDPKFETAVGDSDLEVVEQDEQ